VDGIVAEAPDACVSLFLDRFSNQFLGLAFADTSLTDDQLIAVCDLIEADQKHLHAVSTSTAAVLDPTSTTDIASRMLAKSYKYSFG
ncbi:DUF3383 family protein, partial [Acinetobacter baumannii]